MVTLAVPGFCWTGIILTGAKDSAEPSLVAGPRCVLACEVCGGAGWLAMRGRKISAGLVVVAVVVVVEAAVVGIGVVVEVAGEEVTGGPILNCTTPTGSFLNSLLVDPPGILSSLLGAMLEEIVVEEEEKVVEVVVVVVVDVSVVVVVVALQVAVTVVASKDVGVALDIRAPPMFKTGRA